MKLLFKISTATVLAASIAVSAVTIVPNSPITPAFTADAAKTKVIKSGYLPIVPFMYPIKNGKVYDTTEKKLLTVTLKDIKGKVYKVKKGVTFKGKKAFTGTVKYPQPVGYTAVTYKKGLITKVV